MATNDDQSNGGSSHAETRIGELMQSLPRDLALPTDLWPRIAASIENPTDSAFRLLRRDVDSGRDLWPDIAARLQAHRNADGRGTLKNPPRRFNAVAAAGVVTVLALAALVAAQFRLLSETPGSYGSANGSAAYAAAATLPARVSDMFSRFENALPGTQAAAIAETAFEIRRDLIMTRFERMRIEQAMAVSSNQRNLRTQWRHAYVSELSLINAAENLSNFQLSRREI